jgi:hypothetical protein
MEGSTDPIPWKNKEGKYVVLVSSDNPWYINTENTVQIPVDEHPNGSKVIKQWYTKTFAPVSPIDEQPTILKTQPEAGVEYFEGDNTIPKSSQHEDKRIDLLICALCILIGIQIIFIMRHK